MAIGNECGKNMSALNFSSLVVIICPPCSNVMLLVSVILVFLVLHSNFKKWAIDEKKAIRNFFSGTYIKVILYEMSLKHIFKKCYTIINI